MASNQRETSRISKVALIVTVAILVAGLVPFLYTHHLAQVQDRRSLTERTTALHTNVSTLISSERTALRGLATDIQSNSSAASFNNGAQQIAAAGGFHYLALVDLSQPTLRIVNSYGTPVDTSVLTSTSFLHALAQLSVANPLTTSNLNSINNTPYVGFLQGAPIAPANTVLYGEVSFSPFDAKVVVPVLGQRKDINAALYTGAIADSSLVMSTTKQLPLTGTVVTQAVTVGASHWTLVVSEQHPVADELTQIAPWIILGAAVIIALLSGLIVNGLARGRDRALNAAQESSQENVSILEAAHEAFISMDTNGKILRWSAEAEALFGVKAADAVGRQAGQLLLNENSETSETVAAIRKFLTNAESHHRVEVDAFHADGHKFPAEFSIWRGTSQGIDTYNAIAHDITARREAEKQLALVTQRALEASQLKSEFLANMSHEIRTPMNGVIGITTLLMDSHLSTEQREQMEIVQGSAEALLVVINDILDFSRIEAGKIQLENAPFNVRNLIDEVRMLFTSQAAQKRLQLTVTVDSSVPQVLMGDPGRIRQVLLNVVGNAVKFTQNGSVAIKCSSEHTDTAQRLYFEVKDTGIGIPAESRHRLFESFAQVDMSSARRHEGTGLGLAISSRLVELMDGEIGVQSEQGTGSTFWFSVLTTAVSDDDRIAMTTNETPVRQSGTQPHVLIVEDNLVNQRVAQLSLERLGCVVEMVGNGEAAVETVKTKSFDVIFMDCQMPGMDGYEATAKIREMEHGSHKNIIVAMTASAMHGDRDKAFASGMDDYLAKPVRMDDFSNVLAKWSQADRNQLIEETNQAHAQEVDVDLSALADLRERTSATPGVYAGIISTFLSQAEGLVNDMREANKTNDREALGKAAHKLRGSSATVGAIAMAKLCTDIEVLLADSHSDQVPEVINKLSESLTETKRVFGAQIQSH